MPARNLEAVIAATREVGDMAMARWRGEGKAVNVWHKSENNPVSDVDLAVEARLKAVLGAMVPEAGWLSEETADNSDRLSRRFMWCVDPIDGTRDFIRGRPGWAVSVALVVDGAPEIGVLYAPALDELWVMVRSLNQYLEEVKPWQLAKQLGKEQDAEKHVGEILAHSVGTLNQIAHMLMPFLPTTATKILETFKDGVVREQPAIMFPKKTMHSSPETSVTS